MEDENRENEFKYHAHGRDFYMSSCGHLTTFQYGPCRACKLKSNPELKKQINKEAYKRKKARDELAFFCEECLENIRAHPGSRALESYIMGQLTKDEAIKLIQRAHNRHEHTDYDEIRFKKYQKYREIGLDYESAHYEAKQDARRKIKNNPINKDEDKEKERKEFLEPQKNIKER
jgi:hypothetical protein